MEYQEELAYFSANFTLEQATEEVIERAKLIILDSLTAIIEGNQSPHMKAIHRNVASTFVPERNDLSSILGTKLKSSQMTSAMVNGIAMVGQEMDEGNPIAKGHPSCHFLPALLSLAEHANISGSKFLESFIVGYEIGVRAGAAIKLRPDIHPHGTWGMIGAGFAIGKIANFTVEEYVSGFNLSGSLPNISLWTPVIEGHRIRDVHIGMNNLHSILIPNLVKSGFSSSRTNFEEIYQHGILGEGMDPEKLVENLGTEYYLMKTYFKFYPFCRFCHSPIDGILRLKEQKKLVPNEIERIDVYIYSLAAQLFHQEVNNEYAGKFSIPYAVARMFFEEENHAEISQMAKRIFVYEEKEFTKLLPHQRNARVEVFTNEGKKYTMNVIGATGDSTEENLREKVMSKCKSTLSNILGMEKTNLLINKAMKLESLENLNKVFELTAP